jgi:hypothetical protein
LRESFPGDADRLTGEAAAQKRDALKSFKIKGADVSMPRNVRPMASENPSTERIDLDLPAAFPAGALKAEVEAADAAEEGAKGGHGLIGQPSPRAHR